jgi:hypothetical protein
MQQKAAIPCRRLVDFCYKLLVQCSCKAQSTYEKIEFFYGLRCLAAIITCRLVTKTCLLNDLWWMNIRFSKDY